MYTTMIQLVRERVYKFLSVDNMQAYTESNPSGMSSNIICVSFICVVITKEKAIIIKQKKIFVNFSDNINSKSHYVKTTAKAGEVFRLLAVFEDGSQSNNATNNNNYSTTKKDNLNSIGREKEKGRYVQLMSENRQVCDRRRRNVLLFSHSYSCIS